MSSTCALYVRAHLHSHAHFQVSADTDSRVDVDSPTVSIIVCARQLHQRQVYNVSKVDMRSCVGPQFVTCLLCLYQYHKDHTSMYRHAVVSTCTCFGTYASHKHTHAHTHTQTCSQTCA